MPGECELVVEIEVEAPAPKRPEKPLEERCHP
jgi:hypothetical protein